MEVVYKIDNAKPLMTAAATILSHHIRRATKADQRAVLAELAFHFFRSHVDCKNNRQEIFSPERASKNFFRTPGSLLI